MSGGKTSEAQIISHLMALIYDAALDPSDWQKFVDALPKVMPGLHPVLYMADTRSATMDLLLMSDNWNHEFVPEYMSYYDNLNPWTPGLAAKAPVGTFIDGRQLISNNELKKTEFYTDFLSNFGGLDNTSGTVIHRRDNSFAVLGVHYDDQMLEKHEEKIARIQKLITPHLIRAFEISRKLGHGALLATTLEYTLEAQSCAAIVIDEQLHVYYANRAARALFEARVLTLDGHSCISVGSDLNGSKALHKALRSVLGETSNISKNQIVKIGSKDFLLPLIAQIMPLSKAQTKGSLPASRGKKQALMIISDPVTEHQNLQPILTLAFDLTASEANLAAALANGQSLSAYARAANIQVDTARSQLKAIFSKTNTHRQAELVSLIMRMTNSFKFSI